MAKVERSELLGCLSASPLFRGLPAPALKRLAKVAHQKQVTRGECFFVEGQEANELFVLASGRVKLLLHAADGGQFVPSLVVPSEPFGALSAASGRRYWATAEAMQAASAIVWKADSIRQALEHVPRFALNALDLVSGRLDVAHVHLSQIATEGVERRVARVLLRLASGGGRHGHTGLEIDFPITRQEIAEMSGTTLFSVSRLLRAWERRGIVQVGRQRVTIVRSSALARIAKGANDPARVRKAHTSE